MFKQKKLSLAGVTLLFISVALIFLSKTAVNQVAFNFVVNGDFGSVSSLNTFTYACALAGYFFMFAGAGLFVVIGWRSRFVVDAPTVKKQLRVLVVAAAVLLVTLSLFCTQAASANSLATTGYYLATPYSPYDWLIGNFSSGTYYAINGSNWANMMTWPTPAPWSDYAGNSTAVIEAALAATSAGTVYLKEVPMIYTLTIPANVQVIENVNGLTRVFVDDAESLGSPYTVSVDTVNPTYYTVQDAADRYIISWTSTDGDSVVNSAASALSGTKAETIMLANDITIDSSLTFKNFTTFNVNHHKITASAAIPMISITGQLSFFKLLDYELDGADVATYGVMINQTVPPTITYSDLSNYFEGGAIHDIAGEGFHYECQSGVEGANPQINGLISHQNSDWGMNIIRVADSTMQLDVIEAARFQQCAGIQITSLYLNAMATKGWQMLGCNNFKVSNFFVDVPGSESLFMAASSRNVFTTGQFRRLSGENNTVDAITLSSVTGLSDLASWYGCKGNTFSAIDFVDSNTIGGNVWRYCANEVYYDAENNDKSTNGNIFVGLNAWTDNADHYAYGTALIRKLGAQSVNGTNIGLVVTS